MLTTLPELKLPKSMNEDDAESVLSENILAAGIQDTLPQATPDKSPMPDKSPEQSTPESKAAVSTPATIDYVQIVKNTARTKGKIGQSYTGKKGKHTLFATACGAVRSQLGLPRFNDDGTHARLPDEYADRVHEAVELFWRGCADELLSFGTVVSYRKNIPHVKEDADGFLVSFSATMKAVRKPVNGIEERTAIRMALTKAETAFVRLNDRGADREVLEEAEALVTRLGRAWKALQETIGVYGS